jgi:hypothetical protein
MARADRAMTTRPRKRETGLRERHAALSALRAGRFRPALRAYPAEDAPRQIGEGKGQAPRICKDRGASSRVAAGRNNVLSEGCAPPGLASCRPARMETCS